MTKPQRMLAELKAAIDLLSNQLDQMDPLGYDKELDYSPSYSAEDIAHVHRLLKAEQLAGHSLDIVGYYDNPISASRFQEVTGVKPILESTGEAHDFLSKPEVSND